MGKIMWQNFLILMLIAITAFPAWANDVDINKDGVITAKPFYDDVFFMVGRKSYADAVQDKTTYSANRFGEEYQPQEGQNKIGESSSFYWDISSNSPCTVNPDGIRTIRRSAICKQYDGATRVSTVVSSDLCNPLTKPMEEIYCIDKNSNYQWLVKNVGQCSVDCGKGTVQRSVQCLRVDAEKGVREIVDDNECQIYGLNKPSVLGSCVETKSCAKNWNYSSYGVCKGLCGQPGTKTREANCRDSENNEIDSQECKDLFGDPVLTMACIPDCSDWVFSEWGECQAGCFQSGIQTRSASCVNTANEVMPDENCPGAREVLEVSKSCTKQCPASTCAELLADYPELGNGSYPLVGPNGTFTATCDMVNGGWTLVPNLAFLSNFNAVSEIKGLNSDQLYRFNTLMSEGMSSYINTTYSYRSGNQNVSSFTKSFSLDLSTYGDFVKSKQIPLAITVRTGVNGYDKDRDQGNVIIYSYDTGGTQLSFWQSGRGDYPQSFRFWNHDFVDSNVSSFLFQHQCWRYDGSACSSVGDFYVYINTDLPKANFYIK